MLDFLKRKGQKRKKGVFLAAIIIVGLAWFYGLTTTFSTPIVSYLRIHNPTNTAFMELSKNASNGGFVPLSKISVYLKQAVILAEDDGFYSHEGFDWEAIKRAIEIDWKRKRFSHGASTITMQLAKNLYLNPRKSILRKLSELLIALKLERELPKDRILELYLNVVQWGNGIYGVKSAAKHYFGKSPAALTKHDAAFLSAILPRPSYYDKHRNSSYLHERIANIERRL